METDDETVFSSRARTGPLLPCELACRAPASDRPASSRVTPYPARVSQDHHFLLDQLGKPFFYMGDTAWELFHRLSREEAESYLQTRAAQQFNVIQAVVLAEYGGLTEPNPQGHRPLLDNDSRRPDVAYFADVDWVVNRADQLGLCIGMLPTWGDKWNKKWGQGPEIFAAWSPDGAGSSSPTRSRIRSNSFAATKTARN